jgi:chromosome segregation ATPase
MSFSINVRSIDALGGFRLALLRYRAEAEETLEGFDYFLARQLEWFDERLSHWQREVRRCREDLRAAELTLARFRAASINPDTPAHLRPGGADRYETALARAHQRLRDAEGHLASTKQWRKTLDQAIEAFRTEQYRFKDVLRENLPAALTMLEKKLATLAGYISVPLPSESERPIAAVPWPAAPREDEVAEEGDGSGHAEVVGA